ncbi:MAG: glycerol-3-phosphate acyltransferase [Paracoccaceae bacterium]
MDWFGFLSIALLAYLFGMVRIDRTITWSLSRVCKKSCERTRMFTLTFSNILKGFTAIYLAARFGPEAAHIATFFVFLGHIYPIKQTTGGNGMAVLLGTMTALHPLLGIIALFSWLFAYFVFRYSAFSAVASAVVTTFACAYIGLDVWTELLALLTALVIWRQRHGLERMMAGTEEMVVWD